jgi:hypothetical protein
MGLNITRDAVSCVTTLELPTILWKPNVHYPIYNSSQMVPILRQNITNPTSYYTSTYVLLFLVVSFLLASSPETYIRSPSPIRVTCTR